MPELLDVVSVIVDGGTVVVVVGGTVVVVVGGTVVVVVGGTVVVVVGGTVVVVVGGTVVVVVGGTVVVVVGGEVVSVDVSQVWSGAHVVRFARGAPLAVAELLATNSRTPTRKFTSPRTAMAAQLRAGTRRLVMMKSPR